MKVQATQCPCCKEIDVISIYKHYQGEDEVFVATCDACEITFTGVNKVDEEFILCFAQEYIPDESIEVFNFDRDLN